MGSLTSGERGFTTTVVCCISASGTYVPPMMIFKRKRLPDELKIGSPGSNVCCNESGCMTKELFVKWLKHFHLSVKCTKEDPVLLILDMGMCPIAKMWRQSFFRENMG